MQLAGFFTDKISWIQADLDSGFNRLALNSPGTPSGPILRDRFVPVLPEDVDRIAGEVRPTTSRLTPCPFWLIKVAGGGLHQWLAPISNASSNA